MVAYYTGFIAINIVICIIPIVDLIELTQLAKLGRIGLELFEVVLKVVGKTGKIVATSVEQLFGLFDTLMQILQKGTEELINFIKKVFKAIEEWVVGESKNNGEIENKINDFLEKWIGKRKSGEGFLGSVKLSRAELKQWEIFLLKEYGTKIAILEKSPSVLKVYNALGKQAGYDAVTNTIWIRKGATNFEILHESLHAQERFILGEFEYLKGSVTRGGSRFDNTIRIYKREKYVFDKLMKHKNVLTQKEIEYSKNYLDKIVFEGNKDGIDFSKIIN